MTIGHPLSIAIAGMIRATGRCRVAEKLLTICPEHVRRYRVRPFGGTDALSRCCMIVIQSLPNPEPAMDLPLNLERCYLSFLAL